MLTGISSYEPTELVVTARAGTALLELEAALGEHGQCLPFEPPRFAPGGTVGGMVAAGLAGPARASAGAVREFVLGVTLLNGRGEILTFGGQVMKNVAGYDVSRLMAGSLGVLGVLCEVSLKVLPVPPATATLQFDCGEPEALQRLRRCGTLPIPLHASCWYQGQLHLRLTGASSAVRAACAQAGGLELAPDVAARLWQGVRDHAHEFFVLDAADLARGECLWRLSVPATSAPLPLGGGQLIEWGGAQRWWRTTAPAVQVRAVAVRAGGHATLMRAADKSAGVFTPLSESLLRIHLGLKRAFDPDGLFNRGRLLAQM